MAFLTSGQVKSQTKANNLSVQDYTVDMFLRQYWYDKRLAHNFTQGMTLDYNHHNNLWVPDLYFYNAKEVQPHIIFITYT